MVFQKVQKFIDSTDIVSFDVFDTLITRKVLHPADVFSLAAILAKQRMNISFDLRKVRIEAEKKLVDSEKKYSYNIQDIYKIIKKEQNLSDELTEQLLTVELEAEEKLVCPRKDVRDLFMELYNSGKKLLLVSDMYLSSSQVKHLLEICGYPDNLDLFVSNEHGKSKSDGSLWKEIVGRFDGKSIFHIGDDKFSDSIAVKRAGQKAFLIKKSVDSFFESKLFPLLQKYDNGKFENSLILGKLSNEILFNNAFSGAYNYDELTGLWTGAALACFIRWLINTKDDSLLLFVTREGYIFQPMYLSYCKNAAVEPQRNCMLFTSRQAVSRAYVTSEKELDDLLDLNYKGYLDRFLETRCNITNVNPEFKNVRIELPRQKAMVKERISSYLDEIIKLAKPLRDAYLNYISSCCQEAKTDKLTIVDVGYFGTTQFLLSKLSGNKIAGKYFMIGNTKYPKQIGCAITSLFNYEEGVHPIYENINFLEASLQVPYGQLKCLRQDKNGNYVTECNDAKQESASVAKAQNSFLRFTNEDAKWYGTLGESFDYSISLAEDIWIALIYYNLLPQELIDDFILDDDFLGNNVWKYDSNKRKWISDINETPLVFSKSMGFAEKKLKIKNFVKDKTPYFMYNLLRKIWIKYIK
ncbi:MAG: HAD hydrolase-like protein [Clostridia bacterium]|nr:HAD hydrolase-like protein [Clostridia bacterium]